MFLQKMASYKMIFVLIFFITLFLNLAPSSSFQLNELKIGTKGPLDQLIGQKFVYKRAIPFMYVTYETTVTTWRNETIFEILCKNLKPQAIGRVEVLRNGIGFKSVTLKLTSRWSRGLDYHIRLYGH